MMTLWLAFAAMMLVACGILLFPLLRNTDEVEGLSRAAMNTEIYRQRLAELEQDFDNGKILEEDYQQLKNELDATLLQEVPSDKAQQDKPKQNKSLVIVFALIPLGAALFYGVYSYDEKVSHWIQLRAKMETAIAGTLAKDPSAMEELQQYSMADFIRVLQRHLQTEEGTADGWYLLGSSYMDLKLYGPANQALRKAYEKDESVVDYGVAYVQTMLAMNGGQLEQESSRILAKLANQFPQNPSVKMVYGMAAFSSGHYQVAVDQWQALLEYGRQHSAGNSDPTTREGEAVLIRSIALAKQKLIEQQAEANASMVADAGKNTATVAGPRFSIKVDVDPQILAQLQPQYSVFVLAKAMAGPPMPLAAKKLNLGEISWPLEVELSNSDAMMPQLKLTSFPEVKVVARISKQGQPIAQSGDWFGEVENLSTTEDQQIAVVISQLVN